MFNLSHMFHGCFCCNLSTKFSKHWRYGFGFPATFRWNIVTI